MKRIYFILLLFVLVPTIGWCQVTYKSFKHYNEEVEIFQQENKINSNDIVMLGNSLTEFGGNWNKLLKVKNVINRGIAGDDAMGIYHRLIQILPGHPKAIFLMVGINDLSHDLKPEQVAELAEKVILKIREESPNTQLYIQSVLPINESFGKWKTLEGGKADEIPEINRLLCLLAEKYKAVYIDLFSHFIRHGTNIMRKELTVDGLHLTPLGYKIWAFEIRKYVMN